jgi:dTDP-4-amino-4,6-dideoxygalactose transaminase
MTDIIPFNKPFVTGDEISFVNDAITLQHFSGDGFYTKECQKLIEKFTSNKFNLLTNSCTAALEMTGLLAEIKPGDEVILPSFTFSSTANAFVLRGATPVFVDICPNTLNIDEVYLEEAISNKTVAIVPVHYAGVSCEMDRIMEFAEDKSIFVIEDAAQGFLSSYKGKALGTIGHFGCLSFHETKNIIAGEGGALLVNNKEFNMKAEMIREKGTDRSQFFRGEVDKYNWKTVGSSYLPSEITSAFLFSQLENAQFITEKRREIWQYYFDELGILEHEGLLKRPVIPQTCAHNAHIFYVVLRSDIDRNFVLDALRRSGVYATFHYMPLHTSPAGIAYGRAVGRMENTFFVSEKILRLPLWVGITKAQQSKVVECLSGCLTSL